jgi:glycerol-3-phosphate dehydrogenase (NAD(P)+)
MSVAGSGSPVAVLGAGSWGTALAIQFARSGRPTRLWGRDRPRLAVMAQQRRNDRYLAAGAFPPSMEVQPELADALRSACDVLIAVPSHAFRPVLAQITPLLTAQMRLAWATKGLELPSGLLPHQVAREVLGPARAVAVLSGPTFAREVGAGLPTAMTIASSDAAFAKTLAQDLSSAQFRAYTSTDIVGVEVGGAVKNVLAVGAGLSDGLGFGANTRVALITRGTFMGLAGLGDLVLTCTDDQSRNRRFGLELAAGKSADQALADIGQVVEGYPAAKALRAVAARAAVEMPLCEGIYRVVYEGVPAPEAVRALMTRPIKSETD